MTTVEERELDRREARESTALTKAETHVRALADDAHGRNKLCAGCERAHVLSAAMLADDDAAPYNAQQHTTAHNSTQHNTTPHSTPTWYTDTNTAKRW